MKRNVTDIKVNNAEKSDLSSLKADVIDMSNRTRRNTVIIQNITKGSEDELGYCPKFKPRPIHVKLLIIEDRNEILVKRQNNNPTEGSEINWGSFGIPKRKRPETDSEKFRRRNHERVGFQVAGRGGHTCSRTITVNNCEGDDRQVSPV